MKDQEKTVSATAFALAGLAVGAVCGVLFAPKKGSELRAGLGEWGRRKTDKSVELYKRVKHLLPSRGEAVAAVGAAKETGRKVLAEAQNGVAELIKA